MHEAALVKPGQTSPMIIKPGQTSPMMRASSLCRRQAPHSAAARQPRSMQSLPTPHALRLVNPTGQPSGALLWMSPNAGVRGPAAHSCATALPGSTVKHNRSTARVRITQMPDERLVENPLPLAVCSHTTHTTPHHPHPHPHPHSRSHEAADTVLGIAVADQC
jgi:hypothetical protein